MSRGAYGTTSDYLINGAAPVAALPMTLAVRSYLVASGAAGGLIRIQNIASTSLRDNWALNLDAGGTYAIAAASSSANTSVSDSVVLPGAGVWAHLVGVFASATSRTLYVNGTVGATSTTSRVPSGVNRVGLGARIASTVANPANCYLADAAVWDVALTADEAAAYADGVSPLLIRPGSLIAYWPLYGRTSPEPDLMGWGDLTVTGSVSRQDHPPLLGRGRVQIFVPAAAGDLTLDGSPGQLVFVGQSGTLTLSDHLSLTTEPGRLLLIGQQASLTLSDNLSLDGAPGRVLFTGHEAALTLTNNLALTAEPGRVLFIGQQADLAVTANLALAAEPGLLQFHGQVADLTLSDGLVLDAQPGTVRFVGQQADLALSDNLSLDAQPGNVVFRGQSADLLLAEDITLDAAPGHIVFRGQAAEFALNLTLDAQPGTLRFVGQQASLTLTENLALDTAPGYVRLHGQVADLTVTGPIVITGEPGHLRFRGLAAEITLTGGGDTDIATNPKLIARHYPNLEFRPVGRKRWKVEGREAELDILPFKRGLGIGPVVVPPLPPRPKAPVTKLPVAPKKAPPPPPALVIAPPALPPPAPIDDPRVPALELAVEAIRAEYDVTLRRLLLAEGEAASLRDELRAAHDGFAADIAALRKEVADLAKLARQARNLAIRR